MTTNKHNGYPVVIEDGADRPKTYHGFILRKQLLILLDKQLYHRSGETTPGMLGQEHITVLMNYKPLPLENMKLPPKEAQDELYVDLRPYMDTSHVIIQSSFHFMEAYHLFKIMGLRHLPVVDDKFQVIGIITRHDLLYFLVPSQQNDH